MSPVSRKRLAAAERRGQGTASRSAPPLRELLASAESGHLVYGGRRRLWSRESSTVARSRDPRVLERLATVGPRGGEPSQN